LKVIVGMVKELKHTILEKNTLEVLKMVNFTDKALTYIPMETNILENGKKINILPQIT
jgi:hypothetical protein